MLFEVAIHLNTQSIAYLKLWLICDSDVLIILPFPPFPLSDLPIRSLIAAKLSPQCRCSKPPEFVAQNVAMIDPFSTG